MAFDSFSIRHKSDNKRVNVDELDKLVCEEFHFDFSEKDYGHFFFTESEEELGSFQESISWAGLLHTIVYYSNINYGKASIYDIEAAMAWVKEHAVHFPHSTIVFTTKLMKFIESKGLYVFVNFHRDENRNRDEYYCSYNSYTIFRNESGAFECDDDGTLMQFYPDINNLLDEPEIRYRNIYGKVHFKPSVHSLIIPEGVTCIGEDFFRCGLVKDVIVFPKSLKAIGYCAFADSSLPDVVISNNVSKIGDFAFGNSIIHSVRLTIHLDSSDSHRQFQDAKIGTLYVPKEWMKQNRSLSTGYVYLDYSENIEFF